MHSEQFSSYLDQQLQQLIAHLGFSAPLYPRLRYLCERILNQAGPGEINTILDRLSLELPPLGHDQLVKKLQETNSMSRILRRRFMFSYWPSWIHTLTEIPPEQHLMWQSRRLSFEWRRTFRPSPKFLILRALLAQSPTLTYAELIQSIQLPYLKKKLQILSQQHGTTPLTLVDYENMAKVLFPIDVEYLNRLMIQWQSDVNYDNMVIVRGVTGSGKSTILQVLLGLRHKYANGVNGVIELDGPLKPEYANLIAGNSITSVTSRTHAYHSRYCKYPLLDTPGRKDTRGSQIAILNYRGIKKATQNCKRVIALQIIETNQLGGRGGGTQHFLEHLEKQYVFNSVEDLQAHLVVIINKIEHDDIAKVNLYLQNLQLTAPSPRQRIAAQFLLHEIQDGDCLVPRDFVENQTVYLNNLQRLIDSREPVPPNKLFKFEMENSFITDINNSCQILKDELCEYLSKRQLKDSIVPYSNLKMLSEQIPDCPHQICAAQLEVHMAFDSVVKQINNLIDILPRNKVDLNKSKQDLKALVEILKEGSIYEQQNILKELPSIVTVRKEAQNKLDEITEYIFDPNELNRQYLVGVHSCFCEVFELNHSLQLKNKYQQQTSNYLQQLNQLLQKRHYQQIDAIYSHIVKLTKTFEPQKQNQTNTKVFQQTVFSHLEGIMRQIQVYTLKQCDRLRQINTTTIISVHYSNNMVQLLKKLQNYQLFITSSQVAASLVHKLSVTPQYHIDFIQKDLQLLQNRLCDSPADPKIINACQEGLQLYKKIQKLAPIVISIIQTQEEKIKAAINLINSKIGQVSLQLQSELRKASNIEIIRQLLDQMKRDTQEIRVLSQNTQSFIIGQEELLRFLDEQAKHIQNAFEIDLNKVADRYQKVMNLRSLFDFHCAFSKYAECFDKKVAQFARENVDKIAKVESDNRFPFNLTSLSRVLESLASLPQTQGSHLKNELIRLTQKLCSLRKKALQFIKDSQRKREMLPIYKFQTQISKYPVLDQLFGQNISILIQEKIKQQLTRASSIHNSTAIYDVYGQIVMYNDLIEMFQDIPLKNLYQKVKNTLSEKIAQLNKNSKESVLSREFKTYSNNWNEGKLQSNATLLAKMKQKLQLCKNDEMYGQVYSRLIRDEQKMKKAYDDECEECERHLKKGKIAQAQRKLKKMKDLQTVIQLSCSQDLKVQLDYLKKCKKDLEGDLSCLNLDQPIAFTHLSILRSSFQQQPDKQRQVRDKLKSQLTNLSRIVRFKSRQEARTWKSKIQRLEEIMNELFPFHADEHEVLFRNINIQAQNQAKCFCEIDYLSLSKVSNIDQKITGLIDICNIDSLFICRSEYREKAKRDIEVNLRNLVQSFIFRLRSSQSLNPMFFLQENIFFWSLNNPYNQRYIDSQRQMLQKYESEINKAMLEKLKTELELVNRGRELTIEQKQEMKNVFICIDQIKKRKSIYRPENMEFLEVMASLAKLSGLTIAQALNPYQPERMEQELNQIIPMVKTENEIQLNQQILSNQAHQIDSIPQVQCKQQHSPNQSIIKQEHMLPEIEEQQNMEQQNGNQPLDSQQNRLFVKRQANWHRIKQEQRDRQYYQEKNQHRSDQYRQRRNWDDKRNDKYEKYQQQPHQNYRKDQRDKINQIGQRDHKDHKDHRSYNEHREQRDHKDHRNYNEHRQQRDQINHRNQRNKTGRMDRRQNNDYPMGQNERQRSRDNKHGQNHGQNKSYDSKRPPRYNPFKRNHQKDQ